MSFIFRKNKGSNLIIPLFSTFIIILLFVICYFATDLYILNSESEIVSDCQTASNLAVFTKKNWDIDLLSQNPGTNDICMKDPAAAFDTFKRHLKYNFSLNDDFSPKSDTNFIKGHVVIKKFILYNVRGNDIYEYDFNSSDGTFTTQCITNGKNVLKTPKGTLIETTTVHSEIEFSIYSSFNNLKTVDYSIDDDIIKS